MSSNDQSTRNICCAMKQASMLTLFVIYLFTVKGFKQWQRNIDEWTDLILAITRVDNDDYYYFNDTLDNILVPRVSGSIGNQQVKQFITERMQSLGWNIEYDSFTSLTVEGMISFTNIIATLDPSACRRLVLACHYDSKNIPDFVGATDSAVPCAMIIYIAWVLNDYLKLFSNESLDHPTLQVIFFDGEEAFKQWTKDDSLYGSRHLSEKWSVTVDSSEKCPWQKTELQKIELFVLLDLIGSKDIQFCSMFQNTNDVFLQLSTIEKQLNNLDVLEKEIEETGYFVKSCFFSQITDDHVPFLEKGIPVLHLIPNKFPKIWHQVSDDMQHLHHPTINNLNQILKVFVYTYLTEL